MIVAHESFPKEVVATRSYSLSIKVLNLDLLERLLKLCT